jgi:hypothetical protein
VFDPAPEVLEGDGCAFATETPDGSTASCSTPRAPASGACAAPEARWRKQPSDVAELDAMQAALLDAAVAALQPGGILAYVTCSPHLAETAEIVDAALARHPDLTRTRHPAVVQRIATRDLDLPAGTHAQLWPHRHGTDAMFIQLLAPEGGVTRVERDRPDQPEHPHRRLRQPQSEVEACRDRRRPARRRDGQPLRAEPDVRPAMVERLQQVSPIPLDVHLMITDVDRWAPGYAELGRVLGHVPRRGDAGCRRLARRLRQIGRRAGLASSPAPPSSRTSSCCPSSTSCWS